MDADDVNDANGADDGWPVSMDSCCSNSTKMTDSFAAYVAVD